MRKDEFPLVDKIKAEAYQQGREDAISEIEDYVQRTTKNEVNYTYNLQCKLKEMRKELL